jgi:hypothetical protein
MRLSSAIRRPEGKVAPEDLLGLDLLAIGAREVGPEVFLPGWAEDPEELEGMVERAGGLPGLKAFEATLSMVLHRGEGLSMERGFETRLRMALVELLGTDLHREARRAASAVRWTMTAALALAFRDAPLSELERAMLRDLELETHHRGIPRECMSVRCAHTEALAIVLAFIYLELSADSLEPAPWVRPTLARLLVEKLEIPLQFVASFPAAGVPERIWPTRKRLDFDAIAKREASWKRLLDEGYEGLAARRAD